MSNRESWTLTVGLYDDDTGDPIALNDAQVGDFSSDFSSDFADSSGNLVSFQFDVRRSGPGGRWGSYGGGYGQYYGIGSYDCSQPILTASLGNGITIVDVGIIQIYFSETQMRTLSSGTWDVGCTMASIDGIDVRQVFRAKLPILSGWVTT
jgi:hypothetical protein